VATCQLRFGVPCLPNGQACLSPPLGRFACFRRESMAPAHGTRRFACFRRESMAPDSELVVRRYLEAVSQPHVSGGTHKQQLVGVGKIGSASAARPFRMLSPRKHGTRFGISRSPLLSSPWHPLGAVRQTGDESGFKPPGPAQGAAAAGGGGKLGAFYVRFDLLSSLDWVRIPAREARRSMSKCTNGGFRRR
jgi:hypothetical protein